MAGAESPVADPETSVAGGPDDVADDACRDSSVSGPEDPEESAADPGSGAAAAGRRRWWPICRSIPRSAARTGRLRATGPILAFGGTRCASMSSDMRSSKPIFGARARNPPPSLRVSNSAEDLSTAAQAESRSGNDDGRPRTTLMASGKWARMCRTVRACAGVSASRGGVRTIVRMKVPIPGTMRLREPERGPELISSGRSSALQLQGRCGASPRSPRGRAAIGVGSLASLRSGKCRTAAGPDTGAAARCGGAAGP